MKIQVVDVAKVLREVAARPAEFPSGSFIHLGTIQPGGSARFNHTSMRLEIMPPPTLTIDIGDPATDP